MTEATHRPDPGQVGRAPGLSPVGFIVGFGIVSCLADFVYEGARAVTGPYLATLGASAALVGVITGAGEAVALVSRLFTGRLSDRSGRHWALSIAGYVLTVVSVPLLAVARTLAPAALLVNTERFGKAVRTPARDTMLAQAATDMGRGWAFAIHEALDQSGALLGPLLVAFMLWLTGSYRSSFAVLAIPGVLVVATITRLRAAVPDPSLYEADHLAPPTKAVRLGRGLSAQFWAYAVFTGVTMLGFSTYAVLAFHLQVRHVVPTAQIPVIYAVAMGAAALAALASGRAYDRAGLRVLFAAPVAAAGVPFLSFSGRASLVWLGALLWGVVMGLHESTMRAAVADMVPPARRGEAYGTFTAVYGVAWLAGAALIGLLYDRSATSAEIFVAVIQLVALVVGLVALQTPARNRAPR
ncbi:MAG TPA: MFS transporter [Acidimicrobiales bacterium]|nr:MFS transporter [Acidimicrobiales bacterium]